MSSGGTLVKTQHFTPPKDAPAYVTDMLKDLGLQEWVIVKGKKRSNPVVERYIEKVHGKPLNALTTAWCAYWLGAKLEYAGIPSTKSGMARSYLKWGIEVKEEDWRVGDIVVIWRGKHNDGVTGHVFCLLYWDAKNLYGIGGNQGDAVTIQAFPRRKKDSTGKVVPTVLGVRRPKPVVASRTIKAGAGATTSEALSQVIEHSVPDKVPESDVIGQVLDTADRARPWLENLATVKPFILYLLSAITAGLVLYAMWCRYDDWKRGQNT